MPQIPIDWFECVFYIYGNRSDAEVGASSGGTGFMVGIPSPKMPFRAHVYAVTNSHLLPSIDSGESVFVRFNLQNGESEILELPEAVWYRHPDGDDVALCEIGLNLDQVALKYISAGLFLTDQVFLELGIGPGDEVFMIGRLQRQEGEGKNVPAARFGYLSKLFAEEVRHPYGLKQVSFVVEMRSLGGYSGSPVFVYLLPYFRREPHQVRGEPELPEVNLTPNRVGPWLIGIDWGHLHGFQRVLHEDKRTPEEPGRWVRENSGMTVVIPIDRITDLLHNDELTARRISAESHIDAAIEPH